MVTFACSRPIRNAVHGSSTVPGEGRSLIWHMRVCAAEQGMIEQDVFLDWKPFKEYEDLR